MASSSKKRTTMAKLNREQALRERRLKKEARKNERKRDQPDSATDTIAHGEPEDLSYLDRPDRMSEVA